VVECESVRFLIMLFGAEQIVSSLGDTS